MTLSYSDMTEINQCYSFTLYLSDFFSFAPSSLPHHIYFWAPLILELSTILILYFLNNFFFLPSIFIQNNFFCKHVRRNKWNFRLISRGWVNLNHKENSFHIKSIYQEMNKGFIMTESENSPNEEKASRKQVHVLSTTICYLFANEMMWLISFFLIWSSSRC